MLKTAKVDQNLLDNLGKGLNNLATSAQQMNNLSNAAVATNEYAKNVQSASSALAEMNKSYGTAMKAVTAHGPTHPKTRASITHRFKR